MIENRELAWDGCVNVRDLGGLGKIRRGALVRMEAPTRLSERGWSQALDHGVRTIVDLRSPGERTPPLVPPPREITTVRVPLDPVGTPFHEHWMRIDKLSTPLYYRALLAEHPELVIAAVRAIATAVPGCVVFHCAGGKDRTGLLALVLLTLGGASTDEIIADYLLTYERMRDQYAELGQPDLLAVVTEFLAEHDTTIEDTLAATVESLTMPDYLLDNGLSEADLDALLARLTG